MTPKPVPTWQSKLNDALRSDPKRTGVLVVLALVLVVVLGRTVIGSKADPAPATANVITPAQRTMTSVDADLRPSGKNDTAVAVQRWLTATPPKITRNLFAVRLEYYPQLSSRSLRQNGAARAEDDKSAAEAADVQKQRQARIDAVQALARQLKLQSTVMSVVPQALINGQMLKEGDVVVSGSGEDSGSFQVLKIEPRRVIVERDNVKLEIVMK